MIIFSYVIAVVFAIISIFTTEPAPLIAGLMFVAIGMFVERIYK
jgi:hypothetical protein